MRNPRTRRSTPGRGKGKYRTFLNIGKFARHYEQAEAQGYLKRQGASTASTPSREPGVSEADDMDMESETVEQQTTDSAKRTDMDEKKDDGTLDPRTLHDESSTHWRLTSFPALTEQGQSSMVTQESVRAELEESEEMEVCIDDTVSDNEDFDAEIDRVFSGHYSLDDVADDTEDFDASNTTVSGGRFSGGHYVLGDVADNTEDINVNESRASGGHFSGGHYILENVADNTEDLGADDSGDSIGRYTWDDILSSQCSHTEDIDANNTTDCDVRVHTEDDADNTSVSRLATSGEDISVDLKTSPSNANAPQNSTPAKKNEIPAEGRQIITVSPELDIDHTEEPDESPPNSNCTETGTETWKEYDEMSDNTEVPANSVASLNQNNIDYPPFNFLGCPDKVRQMILHHVLHSENMIKPYYNFGALELPAHKATRENYPTVVVAFAGNAELVDQASTILYGENIFNLRDSKAALWWLKRIGPANVSRLKYLSLTLDEGIVDHFGTRTEAIWRRTFSFLHLHQQLFFLSVDFRGWTRQTTTEDGLSPEDSTVWGPRYAILRILLKWRGLGESEMDPGEFVLDEDARVLADAVTMDPGQTSGEVLQFEDVVKAPVGGRYSFD